MRNVELNDDILLNVQKPARYIGEEYNIVKKEWDRRKIKACLCYPDVYEIGMSHLGLKILYHILNKREDVLCERCFAPWIDMEKVMLDRRIPLFSLESRMPLASFDLIGFSLQHELTYTNLLNMLSLSGIPLGSSQREDSNYPLIIAGGPCAFNPEPLADFIDLFLIGDGEEALIDIVEVFKRFKASHRSEILKEMMKIEGVYVPSFCDRSKKIKKRIVKTLKSDTFPTRPLVPNISTVHDRITLEIMRGCLHRCRFCQARSIYTPVRTRRRNELLSLARQTYKNTGLDEISLVSLSSSSYPGIEGLLQELILLFAPLGVGISLPSLRIKEDLKKLPSLIYRIRKSGLTFAPEVGTERMLRVINKTINFKELFQSLEAAYRMGWQRVKLYFMIGLPYEEEADLEAIVRLAEEAAMLKKKVSRRPADVVINVSSFIPKPHTPFQWVRMADADELKQKQQFLVRMVAGTNYLRLKFHNVEMSILEGVFSRGDRRLGQVLLDVWRRGARFDAWGERFNPRLWDDAFRENRIYKDSYLREHSYDEVLPWEHILCGIDKGVLIAEADKRDILVP